MDRRLIEEHLLVNGLPQVYKHSELTLIGWITDNHILAHAHNKALNASIYCIYRIINEREIILVIEFFESVTEIMKESLRATEIEKAKNAYFIQSSAEYNMPDIYESYLLVRDSFKRDYAHTEEYWIWLTNIIGNMIIDYENTK